ncbi:hypothetical protein EDB89DRAFT_1914983 [Lactarius sanguifluus]|nr:hypothetical protein EDB89DRAFT_1914983 [Lactarius sanguifluus]
MTTTVTTVVVAASGGKQLGTAGALLSAGVGRLSAERGNKPRKPWQEERIPVRVVATYCLPCLKPTKMKKHTSQLSHHKYLGQGRRHHATGTTTVPSGGQRDLRAPLTA